MTSEDYVLFEQQDGVGAGGNAAEDLHRLNDEVLHDDG